MVEVFAQDRLHPNRRSAIDARSGAIYLSNDLHLGNVDAGHDKMRSLIRHPLSAVSLDLLDVAAYLQTADHLIKRDARMWTRDIVFHLPVRELDRWQACEPTFTKAISRLAGDKITFVFTQLDTRDDVLSLPTIQRKSDQDCVMLFSGGLDSCAGAAQKLLRENRRPILVSHTPSPIGHVQKQLAEALFKTAKATDQLQHFRLRLGLRSRARATTPLTSLENSQRIRSFLHLALGTVAAQESGLKELYVVDNGILSINLPLVPCRAGSRSTRSTDPEFLRDFQDTINILYAEPLIVMNPFLFKTKSDIVELLADVGLQSMIKHTVSCWAFPLGLVSLARAHGVKLDRLSNGEHRSPTHCGYCLPCLIRRTAILACELGRYDARYYEDVIGHFGQYDWDKTLHLRDLAYFCTEVDRLGAEVRRETRGKTPELRAQLEVARFRSKYPESTVVHEAVLPPGIRMPPMMLLAHMYNEFARETLTVLREHGDRALQDWIS